MNILIIEDEPAAARRLERFLKNIDSDVEILGILPSIEESVKWLSKHESPELIFMDIQLEDGQSFEILNQVTVSSYLIFTTAYDEYAIKAFKYNSIDYLLKPLKELELGQAINKYNAISKSDAKLQFDYKKLAETIETTHSEKPKRILMHVGSQLKTIEIIKIAYVYTKSKVVFATTFDGKRMPIDFSLDQFEEMTNPEKFFRINRQFIINVDAIDQMHVYSKSRVKIILTPPCDEETIVSTERAPHFKKWMTGSIKN